jgi:hypothetical protein
MAGLKKEVRYYRNYLYVLILFRYMKDYMRLELMHDWYKKETLSRGRNTEGRREAREVCILAD